MTLLNKQNLQDDQWISKPINKRNIFESIRLNVTTNRDL